MYKYYYVQIWKKCDLNIPCIVKCMTIIYILSTNAPDMRHNTSDVGMPYR